MKTIAAALAGVALLAGAAIDARPASAQTTVVTTTVRTYPNGDYRYGRDHRYGYGYRRYRRASYGAYGYGYGYGQGYYGARYYGREIYRTYQNHTPIFPDGDPPFSCGCRGY